MNNLVSPILPGILFLVVPVVFAAYAPASVDVSAWGLSVLVDGGPGGGAAARTFSAVQNPFVNQHTVALANGLTTASAQYDISWLVNYGSFNISAQLAAQDGYSVSAGASGTIFLQTDTDLMLSVDSFLDYSLPTYGLYAHLGFGVRDLTLNQQLFGQSETYGTVVGPPGSGVLSIIGSVMLPAGHQLRVNYGLTLDTFGASSGLATADGAINFMITPEPSTLALLVAGGLLCRPRRRSRLTAPCRRTPIA